MNATILVPYGPPEDFKQMLETDEKIKLSWKPPKDAKGHIKVCIEEKRMP